MEFVGQQFDIKFESIVAKRDWILPTLELKFERSSGRIVNQPEQDYIITNLNIQASIKKDDSSIVTIGHTKSISLQQTWSTKPPSNTSDLIFDLAFDNYTLSQIEKIRRGGKLSLYIRLSFQAFPVGDPKEMEQYCHTIETEIAKSTWVEDILPRLDYKNVALVEIPKLEYEKLNEAINALNFAWKSYSMGDTSDVLVECRKTLEAVGNQVKKAGFRKMDDEGKPRPDWKRFFDSDSKGGAVKSIVQAIFSIVVSGAHVGDPLEMYHAYFALLQAFSVTQIVISRFKMIESNC
ncbi:MAG: hypothetical protein WAM14_22730 [Candidatus Nitrosopolaris sp.]